MLRLEFPPTKSALRKVREELKLAREGYDLLNQKREILVLELLKYAAAVKESSRALAAELDRLYDVYRLAAAEMGADLLCMKSAEEVPRYLLRPEKTRLMGLSLPGLRLRTKRMRKCSGFAGTVSAYDRAKQQSIAVLPALAGYGAALQCLALLGRELKKVQRRLNALEKLFIPHHEEAKKYIAERIEEMEREEISVKKLIRRRLAGEGLS